MANKRRGSEKTRSRKLGYSLTYARQKRERVASRRYVQTAIRLAQFVPKLRPIAKKKRLSRKEKNLVDKFAKLLKGVPHLVAVDRKTAKARKKELFHPDVDALQLRGVSSNAVVMEVNKNLILTSNGRHWLLIPVNNPANAENMEDAAVRAYNAQFPVERLAELAHKSFTTLSVIAVSLWTERGIANEKFETLNTFLRWLHEKWQAGVYFRPSNEGGSSNPDEWIRGIAVWIEGKKTVRLRETPHTKGRKVSEMG